MELELGQTICSKQDEDLENCPLQEGPREKKVWEYDEHSHKGGLMGGGLGKLSGMVMGQNESLAPLSPGPRASHWRGMWSFQADKSCS